MNSDPTARPAAASEELSKILAEPYAFALVTWPAVVGLTVHLPLAWTGYARLGLALWLAAMHLAAYGRGRGAGFGNITLCNSGLVFLACTNYPSPWTLVWLAALLIGLHAAQRARLNRMPGAAAPQPMVMPAGESERN